MTISSASRSRIGLSGSAYPWRKETPLDLIAQLLGWIPGSVEREDEAKKVSRGMAGMIRDGRHPRDTLAVV